MKITGKTTFAELLSVCPPAGEILFGYGLHCIGCHMSAEESIENGARAHGLSDSQISDMLDKINKKIKEKR